jgi:hypothetical protein
MTKPFIPFYKPYGMTDEEYASEVKQAEMRYAEWEAEQQELQLEWEINQKNLRELETEIENQHTNIDE